MVFYLLFNIMRDNLILTTENALAFERSIGFLQQTLAELRRISFDMMPALLYMYGLDEALRRECAEFSIAGKIDVQYHSQGMDEVSPEHSVSVFRIIQELLKSIKQYSSAQRVYVQAKQKDGTLQLHVHDDGVGIGASLPISTVGLGLRNIRQQVESLKGNMHVDSVNGRGTTVTIALHL